MKIVIDARESGTSTGRYVDKLIEYLHALNPDHSFVILTKPQRAAFVAAMAPRFNVVTTEYAEFSFGEQLGLARQLYGLKADLVHFGMVQQPILYPGRSVTTMHDLTTLRFTNPSKHPVVFRAKQLVYRGVNWWVPRKSRVVLTPSQFVKDDVARFAHVPPEKIVVTHEAADQIAEPAEPVAGLENRRFIMYVGRSQPHKNLENLLEAFAIVKQFHPDLKLVLAGKKDILYERIANKAGERGMDGVAFTGFVSEGQLRWLYEHTAAYVFPSLSEGFGLPGLEAMVHGAPVVSSNATCLPEIYQDGAEYFDPHSAEHMAKKIRLVLEDDKLRTELITKGHKVAASYSWKRMAQQTLEAYEQALR